MTTKGFRWINKISLKDRQVIKKLFKEGFSFLQLAKQFNVDRKTIYYHVRELLPPSFLLIKKRKGENKDTNLTPTPPHCLFKPLPEKFFKPARVKMYKDYLKEYEAKTKIENGCQHVFWTKKCYTCKKIIENEKTKIETMTRCVHKSCVKRCSGCGKKI